MCVYPLTSFTSSWFAGEDEYAKVPSARAVAVPCVTGVEVPAALLIAASSAINEGTNLSLRPVASLKSVCVASKTHLARLMAGGGSAGAVWLVEPSLGLEPLPVPRAGDEESRALESGNAS